MVTMLLRSEFSQRNTFNPFYELLQRCIWYLNVFFTKVKSLKTNMGKVKAALGGCAAYEVGKKTKHHHEKKH